MNTCITCKHYEKSATENPAYDICLNPALPLNQGIIAQYQMIRGVDPPSTPTTICSSARSWPNECGKDGKLWEPKEPA